MTYISKYFQGYTIINILFFIIENNYYEFFYNGFVLNDIEHDILAGVIQTLLYEGIVERVGGKIIFTQAFKSELDNKGKGLLYLVYGYKDIIHNFDLSDANVYDHIDLSYVGKGTNLTDQEENFQFFSEYIDKNKDIKTVADFGCGAGILLFRLAKKYPSIHFIGIDINNHNITKAQYITQKYMIKNINFLCEDIKNIDTLNIKNIDMIIGCYIFHQFTQQELNTIFEICGKTLQVKHLLLKECMVDTNNMTSLDKYKKNTFFLTYYLVHVLSKQHLLSMSDWEKILKQNNFYIHNQVDVSEKVFSYLECKTNEI